MVVLPANLNSRSATVTWLRIDDKFAEHGKLMALPRPDRWTWMELLCYCARQSTGNIPARITELLRYVTPSFLERCVDAGLLDRADDGALSVHDWSVYNPKDPTGAIRQSRFRHGKRNAQSNDDSNGERNEASNASRAGAARVPVPSPSKGDEGRESSMDAAPPARNGREPLNPQQLKNLATVVHRDWDEYPVLDVLHDELTDRGATEEQATEIIRAEKRVREAIAA